jgi:hypothetical protein
MKVTASALTLLTLAASASAFLPATPSFVRNGVAVKDMFGESKSITLSDIEKEVRYSIRLQQMQRFGLSISVTHKLDCE